MLVAYGAARPRRRAAQGRRPVRVRARRRGGARAAPRPGSRSRSSRASRRSRRCPRPPGSRSPTAASPSQVTSPRATAPTALDYRHARRGAAVRSSLFMGARAARPRIAGRLVEHGKDPGRRPRPSSSSGTLPGPAGRSYAPARPSSPRGRRARPSPALVVVGDVVSLARGEPRGPPDRRSQGDARVTVRGFPAHLGAAAVRLRRDRAAQARAAPRGRGRDRPRLRQPGPAVAARVRSRSCRRPPGSRRTTATRPRAAGSRTSGSPICDALPAPLRRRARSRDPGADDDRRQGGALAPDVGARASRATSRSCRRPSYPIHTYAPVLAGATGRAVPRASTADLRGLRGGVRSARSRGRASIVLSFPHNPTDGDRSTSDLMRARRRVRARARAARRPRLRLCRPRLRRLRPPSILQVEGADGGRGRALHAHEGRSRWRAGASASCVGNAEVVGGARAAEVVPRLRHLPADPDRRDRRDERGARLSATRSARSTGSAATCSAAASRGSAGRSSRRRGRCSSGPRSRSAYRAEGSHAFAVRLAREASVAVSPGAGFGPGGEGYVRFALVENEQRIAQATRGIRRALSELEAPARAGR